jgi:protein phosphatase
MRYSGLTHIGNVRTNNEDNILMDPERKIFIVADGLGGQNSGEIASKLAIDTFIDFIKDNGPVNEYVLKLGIQKANEKILEYALENIDSKGMGTTFSGIWINNDEYIVFHLGDSGVFHYNEDVLKRLTEDHTVYNELKKRGTLIERSSDFETRSKHMLVKSLGAGNEIEIDITKGKFDAKDIFILYSDGMTNSIDETDIISELEKSPEEISAALLEKALNKDGRDNISIIVIKFTEVIK